MINTIKRLLKNEFIRFLIVGGFVTVIDFMITALVIYFFDRSSYNNFYEVFYEHGNNSVLNVIATGSGFCVGLIINWILSNFFVFEDSKKGKTAAGLFIFAVIACVGLAIHLSGMWLFNGVLDIQEFAVKIMLTCAVLIFNYFMRKKFIYKPEIKGAVNVETVG